MPGTAIDLFCGCGAVTWGLKQAGFRVVAGLDSDETSCSTYRLNHPEVTLFEADISEADVSEFGNVFTGSLDLLTVCAPCQPFSSQNRNRTSKDGRAELILYALPFIERFRPALVFLENVPGIGKEETLATFSCELKGLGYRVGPLTKVDASKLGVPQRRWRAVLVAGDEGRGRLSTAYALEEAPPRNVGDAIRGLPIAVIGSNADLQDPLHFSRRHHPITIERLRHVPKDGGSRASIPDSLKLKCHKEAARGAFPDTYGRLKWSDVAPTLTTGCTDLTKGRFAHPEHHRAITLREAARLQSFPDEYRFSGNASQIAAQIGNAVPPLMMATIAKAFVAALDAH